MKKIIVILICTLFIATAINVTGQVKDISISKDNDEINPLSGNDKWIKTYGGNERDYGCSVLQTSDGGYIVVGATRSSGAGNHDFWLIKTDSDGNKLWDKTFGGKYDDFGNHIQQTNDGGYILTGSTMSYGDGRGDVWLIKIDSDGNKLWDKTFGDHNWDAGSEVRQTSDGGYIIVGYTIQLNYPDVWLIKTDSDGNKIWDKSFGDGLSHTSGESIQQTSDGGYIIIGRSQLSHGSTDYDVYLIKVDGDGELIWEKTFGGDDFDFGYSIQQTNDGGYILVGATASFAPEGNVWLIKTDNTGELLWDKKYGGKDPSCGFSVQQTNDGGYIIAGYTQPFYFINSLLIKTNSDGEKEWSKTYGGLGNDITKSVLQTSDGGYILTGLETSGNNMDIWLIKTDSNGDVPSSRARSLMRFRLFELFPNLFPLLQTLLQRLGLQ